MYLLAADIGGTKSLMGLARIEQGKLHMQFETRLPSADYKGIEPLLDQFLQLADISGDQISAATLAVAGPVQEKDGYSYSRLTNLPWTANSESISAHLGGAPVSIINDFAAVGYALPHLESEELFPLQAGAPKPGAAMLAVGAGTGLGVCLLDHRDGKSQVFPSEGGHVGFAPANQEQLDLLHYWLEKNGHCSREFLLSGPGIARIGEFVAEALQLKPDETLNRKMQDGDASAAISEAAINGEDDFARRTMQIFADIYASQLGDLALSYLPRGGLFIAGGIAPKILPLLQQPRFIEAFHNKPPMASLLEQIPLDVVMTTRTGLIGALHRAAEIARN